MTTIYRCKTAPCAVRRNIVRIISERNAQISLERARNRALANSDFETEVEPMDEDLPDPTTAYPSRSLARVFDIPELLHMIVSYLPISNRQKTRRVNRKFRDAVENSVALQQTLFQCPRKGLRTPPGQVWCRRRTPDPWDYYLYTVEQQSEQDSFGLGRRFEPRIMSSANRLLRGRHM